VDLYLIRHAHATAQGERGVTTDEDRPLSEKGEAQAVALAKSMQQRGIHLDKLCSSPLLRARQTAEILVREWQRTDLEIEIIDSLIPEGKPRKIGKSLMKLSGDKIGLVGHMPSMGLLTAWLIGDKEVNIEMAKAGVALVTCGDLPSKSLGSLRWLVTPEWY
jgi:phosphohistidine phosphatase